MSGSNKRTVAAQNEQTALETLEKLDLQSPSLFAEHAKPIFKEEFPDIADKFTTTSCIRIWNANLEPFTAHFGVSSFSQAIIKSQEKGMTEAQLKGIDKSLEPEVLKLLPEEIGDYVRGSETREEKFFKTTEAAMEVVMGEFSKSF